MGKLQLPHNMGLNFKPRRRIGNNGHSPPNEEPGSKL